jgi:carnitine O-acetyltransferase
MLNGGAVDGTNRFWDKSSQIVVSVNGKIAYLAEHSMCDGITTSKFVNTILDEMAHDSVGVPAEDPENIALAPPTEIRFQHLSTSILKSIDKAQLHFEEQMKDKESEVLLFHGFGSDEIKTKFKLSPDAFAQMAIQLAGRQVFQSFKATYESTQTRTFAHGRTEVTRVLTQESANFCEAMVNEQTTQDKQALQALLQLACKSHGEFVQQAVKGLGCDRHLLALKLVASPEEMLPLFSNDLYKKSGKWEISTSGLLGERIDGWSFGEVVPTGVGVAYSVMKNRLRFTVTSSTKGKEKLAGQFCAALEDSLVKMKQLYE